MSDTPKRQIVFDTETTGFKPAEGHRVVEIGALELVRGAITGRSFHVYVNPERDMPEGAFRVHGISEEFLRDKPLFDDKTIGQGFRDFVGDAELIAHNASFDMSFMQFELDKAGLPKLANEVIDTLVLARKKFPGSPASLDALCARFGINTTEREKHGHGALLDARLLAEVYIELTGGTQGGFDLAMVNRFAGTGMAVGETLQRLDGPLASRVTPEEQAAHEAFIAEMDSPLWAKTK